MGQKFAGAVGSDAFGEFASIFAIIDPIFGPATAQVHEGYVQEEIAKQEARAIKGQARLDAEQSRRAALYANGQDYLLFTRSGAFSGVGSPLDLLTQNALEREKEALSIELKGWNEAKRTKVAGENYRRASSIGSIKSMVQSPFEALSKFGFGQSQLGKAGTSAAGYPIASAGAAAGIDAAAGGAAAVNGAGTGAGALAIV